MKKINFLLYTEIAASIMTLMCTSSKLYSETWVSGDGNWGTPSNWSTGAVSNSRDLAAIFNNSAPLTVTIDHHFSVGSLFPSGSGSLVLEDAGFTLSLFKEIHAMRVAGDVIIKTNTALSSDVTITNESLNPISFGAAGVAGSIGGTGGFILARNTVCFEGTAANTYSGLTSVQNGLLRLNKTPDVNAISGNLEINGGEVILEAANQIANTSNVTLSSGSLNLNGFAETINSLIFSGGALLNNSSSLSLQSMNTALTLCNGAALNGQLNLIGGSGGNIVYNGSSITARVENIDLGSAARIFNIGEGSAAHDLEVTGIIKGAGGISKTGEGWLHFSGGESNSYAGPTTVLNGTLSLGKAAGVDAVPSNIIIDGGIVFLEQAQQIQSTATMTLTSGTFDMNHQTEMIDRLVFEGGDITNNTTGLFLQSTVVALTMHDTTSLPGPLYLTGASGGNIELVGKTLGASLEDLNLGSAIRTITTNVTSEINDLKITGSITGAGGFTKQGRGRLNLSGSFSNTYTGMTTISDGTLALEKTAGMNAIAGDIIINGGTLFLVHSNQLSNSTNITLSAGSFNLNGQTDSFKSLVFNGGILQNNPSGFSLNSTETALSVGNGAFVPGTIFLTGASGGDIIYTGDTNEASLTRVDLGSVVRTIHVNNGAAITDLTITDVISGSGGLTKAGEGQLYLRGTKPNTFTGLTTVSAGILGLEKTPGNQAIGGDAFVNGGTLRIVDANQLPRVAVLTIEAGTLDLNHQIDVAGSLFYNGGNIINHTDTLSLASTGTALSMRNTTINGPISMISGSGGTINFDSENNGTATIAGTLNLGNVTRTFEIENGADTPDMNVTGVISGGPGVGLVKVGDGTLRLSAGMGNTYSGTTTITAGMLQINAENQLGLGGLINLNGGTLQITSTLNTNRAISITAPSTINTNGGTIATLNGVIGGSSGSLTIAGFGNVVLAGANTYTVDTIISNGILTLPSTGTLGNNSSLTIEGGGGLNLTRGAGTKAIGALNGAGTGIILHDSTLSIQSGSFSGDISGGGGILKTSSGSLTLSGVTTYTGATTINDGNLILSGGGTAGNSAPLIIHHGSFIIETDTGAKTIGALSGSGNGIFLNNNTLTIPQGSFNGNISGSGGITKIGLGTLTLRGPTSYTGLTTLSGGTLVLAESGTLGSSSSLTITNGVLEIQTNAGVKSIGALNGSGDGINLNNNRLSIQSGSFAEDIYGSGGLTKTSDGVLVFHAETTYTGETIIEAGSLVLSGIGTAGSITPLTINGGSFIIAQNAGNREIGDLKGAGLGIDLNNNNLVIPSGFFSGDIAGTGGIIKAFEHTLTLSGATSYTGVTVIDDGTLILSGLGTLGDESSLTLNAGGFVIASNAGEKTISTLFGGGNGISLNNNRLVIHDGIFSSDISGIGGITKTTDGTLTLTSQTTYTGATFLEEGTLTLSGSGTLGNESPLRMSGGTFTIAPESGSKTIGALNGSGLGISLNDNTLNIPSGNFSGSILGTGDIHKISSGKLTLSGDVSLTDGRVTIEEGTLSMNGTLAARALNVGSGGTLGGTGAISAHVTAGLGSTVSPGSSIGTLTITGDYTQATGSTLLSEIHANGASDLVKVVGGTVTIEPGATLKVSPLPGIHLPGMSYKLIESQNSIVGQFDTIIFTRPGFIASIEQNTDLLLTLLSTGGFIRIGDSLSGNAKQVAHCLEQESIFQGTDLFLIAEAIQPIEDSSKLLQNALDQLQPSLFGALNIIQESQIVLMQVAISHRIEAWGPGISKPPPDINDPSTLERWTSVDACSLPSYEWNLWVKPVGEWIHQRNRGQNIGYASQTYGGILGADKQILPDIYFGLAAAYAHNHIIWKSSRGDASSNNGYAAAYGLWQKKQVYLLASIIGNWNKGHGNRNIQFSTIDRTATHKNNSYGVGTHIEMAYSHFKGMTCFQPFGSLDYIYSTQEHYKESHAGSLNLKVKRKNSSLFRSQLGFDLAYCFKGKNLLFVPNAYLSCVWEKELTSGQMKASFEDFDCVMKVNAYRPIRFLFAPGIGLTTYLRDQSFSLSARWDGEFANQYNNQKALLEATFGF